METIARGSVHGIVATVAMSAVLALGKVLGILGTPPPKRITARATRKLGLEPRSVPDPVFTAGWLAAHFAYGAGCGVLFLFGRRLWPQSTAMAGPSFGLLVWGISYFGLLPGLGLHPAPEQDPTSRSAVMVAAHVVYGSALAGLTRKQ
ncbi:MAG: hypothetical protein NVS2B16_05250 [Chloroflexota bacterium]